MAKGGSRGRRSYTRDARGRFASTPGGGAKPKPPRTSFRQRQAVSLARSRGQTGRLGSATKAAKARLKATRARTGAGASPQQKAALTRAKRMAAALAGERRVKTAQKAGVIKGRIRRDPGAAAKLKPQQPPRRLQRSALDQAHRDKVAKKLRSLEKPARKALQVSKKIRGVQLVPPLTGKRRPSYMDTTGHSRFLREHIQEQANRLMYSPTRGKNKLTAQERREIISDMTYAARKLKARAAMVIAKPSGKRTVKTAPRTGVIKGRVKRDPGVVGRLAKAQSSKSKTTRQLSRSRLDKANANLKARLNSVLDELRKVDNAKNRDNTPMTSGGQFSAKYVKLLARGAKADRRIEAIKKAARKIKLIERSFDPAKFGFARGTDQRRQLAAQLRDARRSLRRLEADAQSAKKAFEADPVYSSGLWGEIGQNRRQSRKRKQQSSNRRTAVVDRYVGTRMQVRAQRSEIARLREVAKRQTAETNAVQRRRKPAS